TVVPQRGATFNDRLAHAWADAGGPGIQIGMDTPQVDPAGLDRLLAHIDGAPGGPAVDGGWWVIGWRRADPRAVFAGLPMSTATTGAAQERRLRALGLDVLAAPALQDIDTVGDLSTVAEAFPRLRTARVAERLAGRWTGAVA